MKYRKSTNELHKEIKEAESIACFLRENEQDVDAGAGGLQKALEDMMDRLHLSTSDLIRKTGISTPYAYAVLKGEKMPTREMLLRILLGIGCEKEEMDTILKCAGYKELYPRDKQDACILFALEKGLTPEERYELFRAEHITLLDE